MVFGRAGSGARWLAIVSMAALPACAAIWGFEDGHPLQDGGDDAGFDASITDSSGDVTADRASDVSVEHAEGGTDVELDQDAGDDGDAAASDASSDGPSETSVTCSGACVGAPSGWQGPFAILEGVGGPPPPTLPGCTGAYTNDSYDGTGSPDAGVPSCACACDAPKNAICSDPVANYFSLGGCSLGCGTANQNIAPTCTPLANSGCLAGYATLTNPTASGGSCTPNATVDVPPVGWTKDVRLCAPPMPPTGSGCDGGAVCAPAASLPFEADTYCVAKQAVAQCPPEYPAARATYFGGVTDTRGCTPCSCGSPTGVTCTGASITLYADTQCQTGANNLAIPMACANLGTAKAAVFNGATGTGGSCISDDGGTPVGSFTPTTPTTICCTK
jgi:hypothetical protein